jgi:hypothetical protein
MPWQEQYSLRERSMGRAYDLLHSACLEIQDSPELFLDYEYVMNVFQPLYDDLPELEEYLDYYKEDKMGNVIGSMIDSNRVRVIDLALHELFYPTKMRNRETTEFCFTLASGIATTIIIEMEDTKKASYEYLSAKLGKCSQAVITKEEELATIGLRATNDPSEGMFATFTDILVNGGRIDLSSAAGLGQSRYNGDFARGHELLVTGRKSRTYPKPRKLGTFHSLCEELQDSLVSICKKNSKRQRKDFNEAVERQRAARAEKAKLIEAQKEDASKASFIQASYLHQQKKSPRCWQTVEQAIVEYEKLKTKKDKLRCVKEQILIRYLGCGWGEAHHPWSRKGKQYEPSELFEHFVTKVIPMEATHAVPDKPPINLPKRPDELKIGTKSAGLIDLDNTLLAKEDRIRIEAMKERDRLEGNGFGDQLMEMQESSWPVERILDDGFKIDMCFEYRDDEGTKMLQWCRGVIESIISDKSLTGNYIVVMIKWNDEYVKQGDRNPTKEKLRKKDYNPEMHGNGSWREDLHHLLKTSESE